VIGVWRRVQHDVADGLRRDKYLSHRDSARRGLWIV
jgi:hypothetical protein